MPIQFNSYSVNTTPSEEQKQAGVESFGILKVDIDGKKVNVHLGSFGTGKKVQYKIVGIETGQIDNVAGIYHKVETPIDAGIHYGHSNKTERFNFKRPEVLEKIEAAVKNELDKPQTQSRVSDAMGNALAQYQHSTTATEGSVSILPATWTTWKTFCGVSMPTNSKPRTAKPCGRWPNPTFI